MRSPLRPLLPLVVPLALLLAACRDDLPASTLNPAGPQAREIDNLFRPVFWIAVGVFVVVEALIVFAVFRFRRRPGDAANPVQVHGNTRLEIIWTAIPAIILAVIAVPTVRTIFALAETPEDPNLVNVRVIGHQWWWEFQYPELGIVTANEIHLPVDQPVHLEMTSEEPAASGVDKNAIPVAHSFWIPRLAGKQDVLPGRTTRMTIQAEDPGIYLGQCAEFCGLSHANMRLRAIAHTEQDFDAWVRSMRSPAPEPAEGTLEAEGAELFQRFVTPEYPDGFSCLACHTVDGTVGDQVGPNLARYGERETLGAGVFDNTEANLRRWLRDPRAMKPGVVMPDYGLSEEQIDALVAYLMSLGAEDGQ